MPFTVEEFRKRKELWKKQAQKEVVEQEEREDRYFEMLGDEIEHHPIAPHRVIRGA